MLMRSADRFFRDKRTGRIVVGQWPNLPLWIFAGASLVAAFGPEPMRDPARLVSQLALLVWAADELIRGVNPWRRCLGAGVLIWMAFGWLSNAIS
jgi:hypothetical protein